MANIDIKDLTKVYPGAESATIDKANLSIKDKEFVVLVGPSGCGKSTLLRMIAGLEEITDGDLHIDGDRVNELSPKDRDIAMVFQNYALYPHMTVFDNMAFGLKLRKLPKEEIEAKGASGSRNPGHFSLTRSQTQRHVWRTTATCSDWAFYCSGSQGLLI